MPDISQAEFEMYVSLTNKEHQRNIRNSFREGFFAGGKSKISDTLDECWLKSNAKIDCDDIDITIRLNGRS